MRLLHVSDTHLGFQAFDVVNDEGVNAREQDAYDAFAYVIDRALELRPDAVLHSGDFFHRPSPSNRALTHGLEQLRRLCDAGIPFYVIAGNHETPKTVYTSPILRALRSLPCVFPIFGDRWECFELDGLAIHGLPHINELQQLNGELERLQPIKNRFNLLMLHTSLGKRYLMEEYGEQIFPPDFETKLQDFQYVALGHWHNAQRVELHPNAWYCGSTERFSDAEAGTEKGFTLLEIQPDGACTQVFEPIPTRPWLKLEIQHCADFSVAELRKQLETYAETQPTAGAILSLNLLDITLEQSLELGANRLRQIFPDCFQLIPRRRSLQEKGLQHDIEAHAFDSLDKLFEGFIQKKYKNEAETAAAIAQLAQKYFRNGTT
jgi:DNA repair exonuclease SbcCD nuclease subunit